MRRRDVIFGALGVFIANEWRLSAFPKNVCHVDVDPKDLRRFKNRQSYDEKTFWTNAYNTKPFTLVGDTNHTDFRIHFFFLSMTNIEYMHSSGVKNVFLEHIPQTYEAVLETISKGNVEPPQAEYNLLGLSRTERNRLAWNALVSFCAECQKRGINFHFFDNAHTAIDREVLKRNFEFQHGMVDEFIEKCDAERGVTNKHVDSYMLRRPIHLVKTLWDSRKVSVARDNDTEIIRDIVDHASETGNVIFYGDDHFGSHEKSMRNLLGLDETIHVGIYGDLTYYIGQDFKNQDQPDFVFSVEDKTAFSTRRLSPGNSLSHPKL